MKRFRTPSFRSWRAVVLHRPHASADALLRQLERLGLEARVVWPDLTSADLTADVIFFDADAAHDSQFPWPTGAPPVPLVALVGSEAPGRLEWLLTRGATAHLFKPVQSGGVFSALVIACYGFEQRREWQTALAELQRRLKLRPAVARALLQTMNALGIDEDEAFAQLRSAAMEARKSVEDYCVELVASSELPALRARRGR